MAITKRDRRRRIRLGIRRKIKGSPDRPRLSVFKSNKGIYVQLIDDINGRTLAATSSATIGSAGKVNIDISKNVGKDIAEKANKNGIKEIVFDRGGYPFHGKVKALADGAREGGLKF